MPGFIANLLQPLRIGKLKRQYISLHGLSKAEAENALARQLVVLKTKRPGQSEEWYLEKIIYDLQKDRRR